jgi:hypothetical protein
VLGTVLVGREGFGAVLTLVLVLGGLVAFLLAFFTTSRDHFSAALWLCFGLTEEEALGLR